MESAGPSTPADPHLDIAAGVTGGGGMIARFPGAVAFVFLLTGLLTGVVEGRLLFLVMIMTT